MYVINYLSGEYGYPGDAGAIVTEYRLLCSGELYNSRVQTLEWRKGDTTRRLLHHPFLLRVVSQPFDDYPQELSLRISAPESVTETKGVSSLILRPDDDIAEDLCALLTLFLRRLITIYAKVRISYPPNPAAHQGQQSGSYDWPQPLVNSATKVAWRKRPVSIGWGMGGVERFVDHNPPPLGIDPETLQSKLLGVARIGPKEAYIRSTRLYAKAMRLIEEWPDVAYQHLVSSIETIAGEVCAPPSRLKVIETKTNLVQRAREMGLEKEGAEELAILAAKDNPWTTRKFRAFIRSMIDDTIRQKDTVFDIPENFSPSREGLDNALNEICRTRGAAVHSGRAYGPSVGVGSGPFMPVEAMLDVFSGGPKVPPVTWFERVTNFALNRYLDCASGPNARLLTIKP